jgi:DNA polymerase III delta prime subunit
VGNKQVLTSNCDGFSSDGMRALRNTLEEYAHNTRFILTANYKHRIITPLQSRCQSVNFEHNISDVAKHCAKILAKENVVIPKDQIGLFQNLVKNPTKLMGLVKTVGDKLDSRIKSGDLKESELISEATEMMNKMKNMPGMGNIQSLLSKMGMGNLSGLGGKVNTAAMEAQLNKNLKLAKTKERIRAKAEANAKAKLEQQAAAVLQQQMQQSQPAISEEELIKIFSSQEKIERTPRGAKPNVQCKTDKKKKGKK